MDRKVFGIGMSKTGTSTLGRCFDILGLIPTVSRHAELWELARAGRPLHPVNKKFDYDFANPLLSGAARDRMVDVARKFRSFHDAPWYMLYRELDEAFPGSQFILTTRRTGEVQARSDWHHNRTKGRCIGEPDGEYLVEQAWRYASHNYHVSRYFNGRERDFLVVCWEDGDGWEKLCGFLGLPIPQQPFPHENAGRYADSIQTHSSVRASQKPSALTAKDRSLSVEVFVISWPGQHANAAVIASQLDRYLPHTTIVYSDTDPVVDFGIRCRQLRRPNELFWTDKFTACLDGNQADLMLVIHADCTCEDWEGMVLACLEAYRKYPTLGVWAPRIHKAGYEVAHTQIARIEGSSLVIVAHTDALVFAIPRAIIDRMRVANYSGNLYGWGIGWMIVVNAYCQNMFAAVDESFSVHHATGRGYPPDTARVQMTEFLKQLSLPEKIQHLVLESHIERLRAANRAHG